MENWKPVTEKGYSNYEVSNLGNVRNLRNKRVLIGDINSCGYRRVCLSGDDGISQKKFLVHKLVCKAFVDNIDNKEITNHIDGDKLNNNSNNLEWVTRSENDLHVFKINKRKPTRNYRKVRCNGNIVNSILECSKLTGIPNGTLTRNLASKGYYERDGFYIEYD